MGQMAPFWELRLNTKLNASTISSLLFFQNHGVSWLKIMQKIHLGILGHFGLIVDQTAPFTLDDPPHLCMNLEEHINKLVFGMDAL